MHPHGRYIPRVKYAIVKRIARWRVADKINKYKRKNIQYFDQFTQSNMEM